MHIDGKEIVIPNNVRTIKEGVFFNSINLTRVTLRNGLEEIRAWAFHECVNMIEVVIPNVVRVIKEGAFHGCMDLMRVTLGSGPEEIGEGAFGHCVMEEIVIPPAVRDIHYTAFLGCTNLTRVKFSDEIEDFVACDAMRDWWNQGVHQKSLRTYCFLVQCGIPARSAGLAFTGWQATIHNMLRIIPTISNEGMNAHFDAIDAKLTMYESLLNEAHVLFPEQYGLDDGFDNGIVRDILSFV